MAPCTLPLFKRNTRSISGIRTGYTPLSKVEKHMLMHGSTKTDLETEFKQDRKHFDECRQTPGQYAYVARRLARQRNAARLLDFVIFFALLLTCFLSISSMMGPTAKSRFVFALSMTPSVLKQAIQTRQFIFRGLPESHVLPVVDNNPTPSSTPQAMMVQPFQTIHQWQITFHASNFLGFFSLRRKQGSGWGLPVLPGPRPGYNPLPSKQIITPHWLSLLFVLKKNCSETTEKDSQSENIQSEAMPTKTRHTAGWGAVPLPAQRPIFKSKSVSAPQPTSPPLLIE